MCSRDTKLCLAMDGMDDGQHGRHGQKMDNFELKIVIVAIG